VVRVAYDHQAHVHAVAGVGIDALFVGAIQKTTRRPRGRPESAHRAPASASLRQSRGQPTEDGRRSPASRGSREEGPSPSRLRSCRPSCACRGNRPRTPSPSCTPSARRGWATWRSANNSAGSRPRGCISS
jgi:hypothetical protein